MKPITTLFAIAVSAAAFAQNPLAIPPTIESNTIELNLQEGVTEFFPGILTNTMGANGALLGPTLILNQGEEVNITVNNDLQEETTIHWHGLHVAPQHDGGPHSVIYPGEAWNPVFTVLDKAGINWYHPHLHMQTDKHVSKGIAGMILVRDQEEAALNLPTTYGVDEFPLVLQTKGFDEEGQILVHTDLDTTVMVNGTINAAVDMPAQIVRLRTLNGSSQRIMEIGFSDDRSFQVIGTDGGLLQAPVTLNRYRLSPGQRVDILLDISGDLDGNFQLMSFGSELPNAIYGASQPGMGPGATGSLPDYTSNPLNGEDFQLLDITVIAPTENAVLTVPETLAEFTPLFEEDADITRTLTFTSSTMGNLAGPFLINGSSFEMDVIDYTIPLDNIEVWSLQNNTPIAHPFHIHDVQFFILDINGNPPPPELQGYNDVVLVPGGMGNVRFIAQFSDHANDTIPYMFHCHMLTHEDMGMMGQFLVIDDHSSVEDSDDVKNNFSIYPNPSDVGRVRVQSGDYSGELVVYDLAGKSVERLVVTPNDVFVVNLQSGVYIIKDDLGGTQKLIVR